MEKRIFFLAKYFTHLLVPCLLMAGFMLCALPALATILIFAPHPDDEAIMSSGVIYQALARGEKVRVAIVTNGDIGGVDYGKNREYESISALKLLGLSKKQIYFFGYGDAGLREIYDSKDPQKVFTSVADQTKTYTDTHFSPLHYHLAKHGHRALYNHASVLADIKELIEDEAPTAIYTTALADAHPDHQATALFVEDALAQIRTKHPDFHPALFETIIHAPNEATWPAPLWQTARPLTPMPKSTATMPDGFSWDEVLRFPVPQVMQSSEPAKNLKYQVLTLYYSQADDWMMGFVRSDEIFWLRKY